MKAVIVEISGKKVVALSKNGEFIKLKNKSSFSVGCEVEIPSARIINFYSFTKIASIAAMFLIFVGLGLGVYTYNRPYSYIDIDINPSIEMTTNVFNRIIYIKGLNKDGEKVLASGKYKNKNIETCIKTVLDSAVKNGYLITDKNNAVLFTVSSKNDEKAVQIKDFIMNSTEKELKEIKVTAEILMENVSIKNHEEAKITGISAGKKLLIERLQKTDPKVKFEDYKNASVKKIIKEIEAEKKELADLDKSKKEKKDEENIMQENKSIKRKNQEVKREEKKVEKEIKKEEKKEKKVEKEAKKKVKIEALNEETDALKPKDDENKLENQDKETETVKDKIRKDRGQKAFRDKENKNEDKNSDVKNESENSKKGN